MNLPTSTHHEKIAVAAAPDRVRAAIAQVERWWTENLTRDGDEFTATFTAGWTRIRVDGLRWMVIAQDDPNLPSSDEWVDTTIRFSIEPDDGGSVLHIEHDGLNGMKCEDMCRRGWASCARSIKQLAETGAGTPFRPARARRSALAQVKPKATMGNHASVLVPRSDRSGIRDFYCGVLGGEITAAETDRDFLRLGRDFFIAFLYGDVADIAEVHRAARAIWLELKTDDVDAMRQAITASGLVTVLDVPDPHLYFQAPGGQCLRLVGHDEDLSFYEGAGAGPDVAKVKDAISGL